MTVTILPFRPEHLQDAAALLAARHRHERGQHPALPRQYEESQAACGVLRDLLAQDGMSGMVAEKDGRLAGFLLGAPEFRASTSAFSGFKPARAAEIPLEGHATARGESQLYQRLYAALSEQWLDRGLTAHYVNLSEDRETGEAWVNLGFGGLAGLAVRDISAPSTHDADPPPDLSVRRAGPSDESAVQKLIAEILRSFAEPPMFPPFLPEAESARAQFAADLLADPACPHWLAFQNQRLVALQVFVEPASSHWPLSPLQSPDRTIYLQFAVTDPGARSAGVGAAFLAQTMRWARDAGYEHCVLHYLTASRAAGFWRNLGFQPISRWLRRAIDDRAIWARGQT